MKLNLSILSRVLAQPWAVRRQHLAMLERLMMTPEAGLGEGRVRARSSIAIDGAELSGRPDALLAKPRAGYVPVSYPGLDAMDMEMLPPVAEEATVILVWGVLGRGWSWIEKLFFDAVEVDDLVAAIARTPEGSRVDLWFRSPGGISTGVPETAAAMRELGATRELRAFTDDLCASAAYWLASQCHSITATPTADVGSIGVYIAFYDYCKMMEEAGVELQLFRAGSMKGAGLMGHRLTPDEAAHIQAGVDESYRLFTADVLAMRQLAEETMQGQTFNGAEALKRNLVDGFVGSAREWLEV